ncbi:hypothetical protein A0J61_00139 [Choanephora cucurbitarum]|uniref:Uncharacterized protein n=1 Tax=Choanephora cucurbitarum TaxID=101091 RepID=A0A1C7NRU3_9FUNG|nr:hypothetical protein A0J61_00139 [Choanephora cucurbitarum]
MSTQPTRQRQIDMNDVEAGSILASLARHNGHSKTMSIHNLVENDNSAIHHKPSSSQTMSPAYDQAADEKHHTSAIYHPTQRNYNKFLTEEKYTYLHMKSSKNINQPTTQHSVENKRFHPYSAPSSKQSTMMKQSPKIRRNGFQAYISYMIYTDMIRKKMRQGAPTANIYRSEYTSPSSSHVHIQNHHPSQHLPYHPPHFTQRSNSVSTLPVNMTAPTRSFTPENPYSHPSTPYHHQHRLISLPLTSSSKSYSHHAQSSITIPPYSPSSSDNFPHSPVDTDAKLIVEKPLTAFLHHPINDCIPTFNTLSRHSNHL